MFAMEVLIGGPRGRFALLTGAAHEDKAHLRVSGFRLTLHDDY